jgi:hypothetical protein
VPGETRGGVTAPVFRLSSAGRPGRPGGRLVVDTPADHGSRDRLEKLAADL